MNTTYKTIYLFFIIALMNIGLGCDDGFVEINDLPWTTSNFSLDNCFYENDLDVLQSFINESQNLSNPPQEDLRTVELCGQIWIDGRLVNLCCSNNDEPDDECSIAAHAG